MRESLKAGFSFGITSGIITTLGLIVGLDAGTHSMLAVIGGILTIAVADAFSDALGMHISKEAEHGGKDRVWEAMGSTFLAKLLVALSFAIPVLILDLTIAVYVCVGWGFILLATLSYFISRIEKEKPWKVIGEHILIAAVVIIIAMFVGDWVYTTFGAA